MLTIALGTPFIIYAEIIDINTASKEDLQKIKGIGPALSERIIEMRKSCYFYPLSNLTEVSGIGEITLKKIKEEGKAIVLPPSESERLTLCQNQKINQLQQKKEPDVVISPSKIDINEASLKELTSIVGIGEARARDIVASRPFYSLDDLVKISGVGQKTLESIKSQGLAWVDPSLQKELKATPDNIDFLKESLLAKTSGPIKKTKPLSTYFTALALSFFSGGLILILKNKLNKL